MSTSAVMQESRMSKKRLVSLQSFLEHYPNREDRYKYEWNRGVVEKTLRSMNRDQSIIQQALLAFFYANPALASQGALIVELDMYIPHIDRTRRAELGFLTRQQLEDSTKGDVSVAPFVIEVISTNDKLGEAETKLNEYFAAGVQVVWQVIPVTETVKVYTSPKRVTICSETDLCSAAPILADFQLPAHQVFGK